MRMRVIGDVFTVRVFELIGIRGVVVKDEQEAKVQIDRSLEERDLGVIFVAKTFVDRMGEAFDVYLERRSPPIVLGLPDRRTKGTGAEDIARFLEASLGIRF